MATEPSRTVRNVLLSCEHDRGFGGVQVVIRNLVRWLERNGRHVHFVYDAPLPAVRMTQAKNALGLDSSYCPMPVLVKQSAIVGLPIFLAYLPLTCLQLARLIRRERIDVINCHYLTAYFLHLIIVGRLLRVPVIVSVHGADVDAYDEAHPAYRFVFRLIMRGATRVVACSQALAKRTQDVFPAARDKITYVHNGLDLSGYTAAAEARVLPEPFLLCVSRHVQKKGIDTLLHAFARVLEDAPELSLVLVGDGPLLDVHKALAVELGIDHRVVFMGGVPHRDVSRFFEACRLFVLPSRDEPFGLVVLEAAYYSKGMVCTQVGGVPEIIADGFSGALVEPDQPLEMAARIVALLRTPELAARMGQRAHQALMTRFLWEQRIHDYIAIYEGRSMPLHPAPSSLDVAITGA